jgi:hypothetical protein
MEHEEQDERHGRYGSVRHLYRCILSHVTPPINVLSNAVRVEAREKGRKGERGQGSLPSSRSALAPQPPCFIQLFLRRNAGVRGARGVTISQLRSKPP